MGKFNGALVIAILAAAACGDNLNVGPEGESLAVETDEDTAVDIELVGTDANGDELGFAITASPQSGVLSGTAPNITYTPDENFFGMDMFSYAVSDAEETEVFDVIITVLPVNDPPTVGAILDQNTPEDVAVGPVLVVIQDVDDDVSALDILVVSDNAGVIDGGGIEIDRTTGNVELTLTPVLDASGAANLTVTASDPDGESDETDFQLTVTPVNDAPTITPPGDQAAHALAFGPLDFTVDDVDDSVSGLIVTATSLDQTVIPDGNIVLGGADADRTIAVTALGAGTGPVGIEITVSDGTGSNVGSFTVTVENNAPALVNETVEWVGNTQLIATAGAGLLSNGDSDGDGDDLTVIDVQAAQGVIVSFSGLGAFTYNPVLTTSGDDSDTITYTVSDGFSTAQGTATIDLNGLVWYVDNLAPAPGDGCDGAGDGCNTSPFNTLSAAQDAAAAGDIIFVFAGDGTSSGMSNGISLSDNQQLIGHGVGLTLNLGGTDVTIVPAASNPVITNTGGVGVTLNDHNVVRGLTIDQPTNDGISGPGVDTLTIDSVTINADGNGGTFAAIDIGNNNPAADVTISITDCTIDGTGATSGIPQLGIDIRGVGSAGGTGALNLDITGTTIVEADNGIMVETEGALGTGAAPSSITIQANDILDHANAGIVVQNRDGTIAEVFILNNDIDGDVNVGGATGAGLDVQVLHDVAGGATDLTVDFNRIFDSGDECIHINDGNPTGVFVGTLTALFDANTLDNCANEGIRVQPDDGAVTWNIFAIGNVMTNNGLGSTFTWSSGDTGATMRVRLQNNQDDVGFTLGCDVDTTTELGSVNNFGGSLACDTDTAEFVTELIDDGNTSDGTNDPVGILTGATGSTAALVDVATIPVP